MKITKYPDNTSYVSETKLGVQVFKINTYEDLWHLNQFVDAFHSQHSTLTTRIKPNIIIPNLIDAQADRRFNKGESSGLKLVCSFLNGLEANFSIFHPHNPELVEGLINGVEIVDNSEFLQRVFTKLSNNYPYLEYGANRGLTQLPNHDCYRNSINEKLILMSSDAGGFKPLMKICDKIGWRGETFSAAKSRSWDEKDGTKFVQQIHREDFGGKDILIVDDILIRGNTIINIAKLLKERNCGKIYAALSHTTIQDPSKELESYFDKIFTTNSKYDEYDLSNIEIIKAF